jgi:hypothetical protein
MALTLNNAQRALGYALSEMGEVMTLSTDGTTMSTKKAVNGATVLAAGTTIAQAVTHVVAVHPGLNKITVRRAARRVKPASPSRRFVIPGEVSPPLGLEMEPRVEELIIELSQGLPMYTHLMGQNAGKAAVRRRSLTIEANDFDQSIATCIEEADETVKEAYFVAEPRNLTNTDSLIRSCGHTR